MNAITYSFLLPLSKKETKKSFRDIIMEHVAKTSPWLNKSYSPPTPKITVKYTEVMDTYKPFCPFMNSCKVYTLRKSEPSTRYVDWHTVDLYKEFYDAMNRIKEEKDNYDFKLFGEPVKFYNDFVQVGYKLIPYTKKSYFDEIDDATRTQLIAIIARLK